MIKPERRTLEELVTGYTTALLGITYANRHAQVTVKKALSAYKKALRDLATTERGIIANTARLVKAQERLAASRLRKM